MSTVAPYLEISQAIQEAGGEALRKCYQCATCAGTCPWRPITHFNIRKMIRLGQLGVEGIEELMWGCSTCKLCVDRCPRGVEIIDIVTAVRSMYASGGMLPGSLRAFIGSQSARGNPWTGDAAKRNDWAQGKYPVYEEGMEYLYFTCCTVSYDPRNMQVARATAEILNRAGVSWGLPETSVNCCGESVRKVGDVDLFEKLKGTNREYFKQKKVKKIVVISPHCYAAFAKEYGDGFEVIHFTELLADLIKKGKLAPKKDAGGVKVTYHDPCYLGRHSGIYDAPREVLKAIPGIELVEMDRTGSDSVCCGGGGGGLWLEKAKGERLSDLRVAEALERASVLATACPYCIAMLEDSVRTMNADEKIKVKDVSELILDSLA
ncbi:MAG: (Fe-S)-binding protein [Syntrophales bacterium]|nr:(Fe-S)-binding protein [Syntrophales bacterium]MDD4997812.1 (Fe-S)-binding protein [Syntrophales bacterium]